MNMPGAKYPARMTTYRSRAGGTPPGLGEWLTAVGLWVVLGMAPVVAATAASPATRPTLTIRLAAPTLNMARHEFSLPAAFWNEHLTNWLDVALCGRPSNFLHETVLSVQTTRRIMRRAFARIGYHPATQWAPNPEDFSALRGQPVLILVRFTWRGKRRVFLLDELISFRGWHTSIGPFGWVYLGTPSPFEVPARIRTAHGGQRIAPDAILLDDPQIALQFRGIIHRSQALLEHPLCFDNWIYPNLRYYRNTAVLPWSVFNSNGKIPVTVTFRRVSEVQFLQAAAKYWHDPREAAYIRRQLPVAARLDQARRQIWRLEHAGRRPWSDWRIGRDLAQVQRCYSALDAAWVDEDYAAARFRAGSPAELRRLRRLAWSFKEHLDQKRAQYHQRWLAMVAQDHLRAWPHPGAPAPSPQIRRWQAQALAARCRALRDGNIQALRFWRRKEKRLSPHDPRHTWVATVRAHLALAVARKRFAQVGLRYAAALAAGRPPAIAARRRAYLLALLKESLAAQRVDLVQVNFHIAEDQGYASAKRMKSLRRERRRISKRIQQLQTQIAALTSSSHSPPSPGQVHSLLPGTDGHS